MREKFHEILLEVAQNKAKEGDERVMNKNRAGEEMESKKETPPTDISSPVSEISTHQKAIDIAVAIEVAMMAKFKDDQAYSMKARSLIFNLKKNTSISARILSGEIEPSRIVAMNPSELASDQKKEEIKQTQEANLAARRTDWATEQAKNSDKEGFFTCFKCGSKKTNFY